MKCTAQDMIDAMREAFTISRKCHLDELISLQSGISASVTHLAEMPLCNGVRSRRRPSAYRS